MKSPEEFSSELSRSSRGAAFSSARRKLVTTLHPEVRQAANRGLQVFPVPEVAQWTGHPEQLLEEATVEISCLARRAGGRESLLRLARHPLQILHSPA